MPIIVVPVHAILTDPDHPIDLTALPAAAAVAHIKAIYRELGEQVEVTIADGMATITLPEVQSRLADWALARFAEAAQASQRGRYAQAIRLYQEGLDVLPDHAVSRRQLGMAYMEHGNPSAAKTQLIKAIQLNPHDAWAYLILGNLYYHTEQDLGSAERYFATAYDLAPDDPYVLNSYAGLLGKRGKVTEAVALFERAIALAPQLPTPRLGLALAQSQLGDDDAALTMIATIFMQSASDDPRHAGVYSDARRTYADLRRRRAAASADADMQRMHQVLAEYRAETGIDVRLESDPTLLTDAKIELAWRTGRSYHAIKFAGGGGASAYLIAHEFEHLRMETAARAAGVNRLFTTPPAQVAVAERSVEKEMRKIRSRRAGDAAQVERFLAMLIPGLLTQLYNLPLDCFINRRIHTVYPWLHDALFTSIAAEQATSRQLIVRSDIQAMTPPRIYQASLTLNAAYALFADDLFGGVTDYAAAYQPTGMLATGRTLYARYRDAGDQPGAEFDLVDAWADVLSLRPWYAWRADESDLVAVGHRPPQHGQAVRAGGVTNPAFFADPMAETVIMYYLLDALKRFGRMEPAAVWAVASEIALLGQGGIDYGRGEQYTLRSLPGEAFGGMELLCLQYVGFKLTHPELDLRLPFDAAYQRALHLYEFGE